VKAARRLRAALTPRGAGTSLFAMLRRLALLLWLSAALPAPAQEAAVDGAGWRAYAEGWTLHFESDGAAYGAETYLPGDAVIWKPESGDCAHGFWTERDDGAICFLYPDGMACWRMSRDGETMLARPAEGGGPALRVARRDHAPLLCPETPAV